MIKRLIELPGSEDTKPEIIDKSIREWANGTSEASLPALIYFWISLWLEVWREPTEDDGTFVVGCIASEYDSSPFNGTNCYDLTLICGFWQGFGIWYEYTSTC